MFNYQCYGQKGLMNLDEFGMMVGLKGNLAKLIFKIFDMDENGFIDNFEFLCTLAFFTKTDVQDRLKSVFQIIDPDNNGSCTIKELNDLFEIALRISSKGSISDAEVKGKLEQISQNYFLENAQKASLDQFSEIMLMDQELKKCLINIGIFSKIEIEHQNHDNDIQMEIAKFEVSNEETEQLINERQELDMEKTINKEIFASFKEESEEGAAENPMAHLIEGLLPSNFKTTGNKGDAPNLIIKLEHVYGYRCHDTRNNVFLNPDGKVIFHASQIGIQLDMETKQQRFVMQNTNEIVSIDSFENLTATGELASEPVLCLWDNQSMQIQAMYSDQLSDGISHIRFSPNGTKLLVATLDSQRNFYIFDVYSLQMGEKQSTVEINLSGHQRQL